MKSGDTSGDDVWAGFHDFLWKAPTPYILSPKPANLNPKAFTVTRTTTFVSSNHNPATITSTVTIVTITSTVTITVIAVLLPDVHTPFAGPQLQCFIQSMTGAYPRLRRPSTFCRKAFRSWLL